jgi:hypothetical protein
MGRTKLNKTSKSPHKTQKKQTKENITQSVTPHAAKSTTKPTGTGTPKELKEKIDRTHEKYVRNPENHPYRERGKDYRITDRKD